MDERTLNFFSQFNMHEFDARLYEIRNMYESAINVNLDMSQSTDQAIQSEEINRLHRVNENLSNHALFIFSDKERKNNDMFRNFHYLSCNNGNRYQYELIGTGVGPVIKIRCPFCGQEQDITDYDNW